MVFIAKFQQHLKKASIRGYFCFENYVLPNLESSQYFKTHGEITENLEERYKNLVGKGVYWVGFFLARVE